MNTNQANDTCPQRSGHATVGKRQIAYTELGHGPVVVMLHGGGPGASGIPNYVRNVTQLAAHFRVIVPDMPGYGASTKGIDRLDPFGDLAGAMFGLLDARLPRVGKLAQVCKAVLIQRPAQLAAE